MKTMLGGFVDGRAPPEAARIANPIVPAAAARRSSRRVIGSLRANTIGPPLRGCNLITPARFIRDSAARRFIFLAELYRRASNRRDVPRLRSRAAAPTS